MSGWEYRFYTDQDCEDFIEQHFPSEVLEAYRALLPGAFKADLFRYCVLLICGGIYADIDVMLDSTLDIAIAADVGFMVPIDKPKTRSGAQTCLWNGLLASSPGHPFLAKALETAVNTVRNRFTTVDMAHSLCPRPDLLIVHKWAILFVTGPCMLGWAVNQVLGEDSRSGFVPGELSRSVNHHVLDDRGIPGRSILLHQNKEDMGAHRFTDVTTNLIIASTDLPDADLRSDDEVLEAHYSKNFRGERTREIYGLDGVYVDRNVSNSYIQITIV
jgi:hypothetical protein